MSEKYNANDFVDVKDIYTKEEVDYIVEDAIENSFEVYLQMREAELEDFLSIEKIIYHEPATIVFWGDGTKTVAVCDKKYDKYDKFTGLNICCAKHLLGNKTWRTLMMREGEIDG